VSVDVRATIVVDRAIAEVATYSGDPANAPTWYRRIDSAEWLTEPPVMLGSRIRFEATFLGRDLGYVYEVVEYTPGEQIEMRTVEGPFPMSTTYTWRAVGDEHTHMTLRNHGEPAGFTKLATPFIKRAMRRAMNQDLGDLKQLLEAR